MRLTERDLRLIRDVCLSHVLSRDQIRQIGYFGSNCRLNSRLRELRSYIRPIETPFHRQRLHGPGPRAKEVVPDRIARLLKGRHGSPRFLQHALAVTNIRIALKGTWLFEQQLRDTFQHAGRLLEVKPDGAVIETSRITFIEADMGQVSLPKFARKLRAYDAYFRSDRFRSTYGQKDPIVLTVTVGELRKSHLAALSQHPALRSTTFQDIRAEMAWGWS